MLQNNILGQHIDNIHESQENDFSVEQMSLFY